MRIMLAAPLLLLGACNVSRDTANNQVTVQFNEQAAQNAAEDVGNTAENIGEAIGNEVDRTADKVSNSALVANGNSAENRD